MSIYYQGVNQRGFGTYPLTGEAALAAISEAINVGYRAFDTAQMYGNEAEVGEALANCGVAREDLCITTKVLPNHYDEAQFMPSVEQSLRDLRVDAVDVLLLHWPPKGGDVVPSLRLLQKAHDLGLARNIGISNYTIAMMKTASEVLEAPIAINQVEFHPLLDQSRLLAGASALGVPLSPYCSVARGEVFKHAVLVDIGAAHGKSAAQVALRWMLQKGVALNTMSSNPKNIRANFDIMDFTLSNVEMAQIDALRATGFRIVTADVSPWAPEFD